MVNPNGEVPLWIDNDSGLESPMGDVDDGFAVSALLLSRVPVLGLSSSFGNTFEPLVHRSNLKLASLCNYEGPIVRGAGSSWARQAYLAEPLGQISSAFRYLNLGPFTNVASALEREPSILRQMRELIFVGTNRSFRLPTTRVTDFNLWNDFGAAQRVLTSGLSLVAIPCDVARKLRVTQEQLESLPGPVGQYLRERSRRWMIRSKYLKMQASFPVWDLVAAMYVLEPKLFEVRETALAVKSWKRVVYGPTYPHKIGVVSGYDPKLVWQSFLKILKETDGSEKRCL